MPTVIEVWENDARVQLVEERVDEDHVEITLQVLAVKSRNAFVETVRVLADDLTDHPDVIQQVEAALLSSLETALGIDRSKAQWMP